MKVRTAITFWLFTIPFLLSAQDSYRVYVDTLQMLIGDQNTLHIEAQTKAEGILYPDFSNMFDSLAAFELIDPGAARIEIGDEGFDIRREVVFAVFDTGYFWLPPMSLYSKADSLPLYRSPSIPIRVEPVPLDSLGLAPIKHIQREPRNWKDYLPLIGLIVLLVAGILLYLFRDRLRRKKKETVPEPVQVDPYERVWQQIEALEGEKLWQQGYLKAFYSRISLILREYLENEFELPALESTTGEIRRFCTQAGIGQDLISRTNSLLTRIDLVKYARNEPEIALHVSSLEELKELVRTLRTIRNEQKNREEEE